MVCPYEISRTDKNAKCSQLCSTAGFTVSVNLKLCEKCDKKPLETSTSVKAMLVSALRSRLIAGDCPRYQVPNPVDIKKAMTKLKSLISNDALEEVFESMIYNQSRIKESDGGHPLTTLNTKFNEIAVEFEMQPVLEKLAGKHNGSSK